MTSYIVGLRHKTRTKAVTIEAEDALIAALSIRKTNRRGDHRHPHEGLPYHVLALLSAGETGNAPNTSDRG